MAAVMVSFIDTRLATTAAPIRFSETFLTALLIAAVAQVWTATAA
jgi:hypothetical protein